MKEPWLVFLRNGKELFAYTMRGSFEGEAEVTIQLLAYEHGCDPADITTKVIER